MTNLENSQPIEVHATPAPAQLAAGIRQLAAAVALILAAFGFAGLAEKANLAVNLAPQIATILAIIGPIVWGAVSWVGQMVTRHKAQEAATLAAQLPDAVARFK